MTRGDASGVVPSDPSLPDLFILGTGQRFPDHFTVETLDAIVACSRVFTLLGPDQIRLLPKDLRAKLHPVTGLYEPERLRRENYRAVADQILNYLQVDPPIGWLTFGHPVCFDSVSMMLVRAAQLRGHSIQILPAVSSLETVLVDVEYDPSLGFQVFEATALVREKIQLNTSIAALLFQIGLFDTDYMAPKPTRLERLQAYLLQQYQEDHSVAVVRSSAHRVLEPQVDWCPLGRLALAKNTGGASLFIPGKPAT